MIRSVVNDFKIRYFINFQNRICLTILTLSFCFLSLGWIWGDSIASKNSQANKLYKEGKFDEALSKWRDAQTDNPDNDKLHYNIGNGLHEQKKYEDAFNEYEKSLDSKNIGLRSKAYYNIGNTHYRMGRLQEAIEDYKKCLEINPDDEDAKYNIEFIKKKLKEKSEKQDNKQEESGKQENKDQKKENQAKSEEDRDKEKKQAESSEQKKEEEKPENQPQAGQENSRQENPEKKQEKQESPSEEKKDEMSKEDAIRLLEAFNDDEKDLQKELRKNSAEGSYKIDKDW